MAVILSVLLTGCKTANNGGTDTVSFEMKYASFGTGDKTMIILPGVSITSVVDSSAEGVKNAYASFLDEYTIYLFDRKTSPEKGYTIKGMSDDTVAMINKLGLKDLYIFGASEGGMIGMQMAIDYPDLVKKLVIGSSSSQYEQDYTGIGDRWIEMAEAGKKDELVESMISTLYSDSTLDQYGDYLVSMYDDVTDEQMKVFAINAAAMNGFDVYDRLQEMKCDVLVLFSKGDKFFKLQSAEKIVDKLNCEYHYYDESYGHAVYDEAADYIGRIHDFFNK